MPEFYLDMSQCKNKGTKMSKINVVDVMNQAGVSTDVSGKWVNVTQIEQLIISVANKCAEIADKNSYPDSNPGAAIKQEFGI